MGEMASQITSLTIVYSTVYPGADQRKHQSSASLAFVRGIHRWPHKWPMTRKTVSILWRHHISCTTQQYWIADKDQTSSTKNRPRGWAKHGVHENRISTVPILGVFCRKLLNTLKPRQNSHNFPGDIFAWVFTEVCSQGSNWWYSIIGSDNSLVPARL